MGHGNRVHEMKAESATLESDPPREVRVRANVLRVIDINKQAQTFTVDVQFEASWTEKELEDVAKRLEVEDLNRLRVDWKDTAKASTSSSVAGGGGLFIENDRKKKELFAPRLRLGNMIQMAGEEVWFNIYSTDGPPIVCLRWLVKQAVFQQVMELRLFPFDVQDLTMDLRTGWDMDDSTNGVLLVKNQNFEYRSICNTLNFVQESEYLLFDRVRCMQSHTPPQASASGKRYSRLFCSIRVQRQAGYWWWNVILPLFIVTTCLFASYGLSNDELADRSAITITLLLAMVAFKFIISSKLPDISYATLIDFYVLLCFSVAFLIVLLQVMVKLGVIVEPVFEYHINATAEHTTQEAANNETATTSNSSGIWSGSIILRGQPVRTVQLSMHMICVGIIWLSIHVVGIVCYNIFCIYRWRLAEFWHSPPNVLWISPLACDATDSEKAASQIRSFLMDRVFGNKRRKSRVVDDVILWQAEEAQKCVRHFSSNCEQYKSQRPCAVIRFVDEKDAEHVRSNWKDILKNALTGGSFNRMVWDEKTKAEHLNPAHLVLSNRKTYARHKAR
jgi:hypothetical protein